MYYELATDFKPVMLTGGQIILYITFSRKHYTIHMFLSVIATLDLIAGNMSQHYTTAIPLPTT